MPATTSGRFVTLAISSMQLRAALDAALAELPGAIDSPGLTARLEALQGVHGPVASLADASLGGVLPPDAEETLAQAMNVLEAALRARAASDI